MITKEYLERLSKAIIAISDMMHQVITETRDSKPEDEQWVYDYLESIYNFEIPERFESGRLFERVLSKLCTEVMSRLISIDEENEDLYQSEIMNFSLLYLSSFAVITKDWRDCMLLILRNKKVLEVACGNGMLTKALRDEGIDVIATNQDISTNEDKHSIFVSRPWISDIERIDAVEAVRKYGKDVDFIILSWPPYEDLLDLNVLKAMREVNQSCRLIIIGEVYGCTGSTEFQDVAVDAAIGYEERYANTYFSSRKGIRDFVQFYK